MEIPMTSFIDFVLKSGSPKMTAAKNIKKQSNQDYDPISDYYKRFREGVQELHQDGRPKKELAKIIGDLPSGKVENYTRMIDGYKSFLGRKEIEWFKPTRKVWSHGNIDVPVNPELGLKWKGQKYLIKLYLKADKPSKDKLASILALMKDTLNAKNCIYAVLDVRNGKFYTHENQMDLLIPLVEGEAQSLEFILEKI